MYSLKITKYKHTNDNNYFSNIYYLSSNGDNNDNQIINCLQLNNADYGDKLYYKLYIQGTFIHFELYVDPGYNFMLASGVQSTNLGIFNSLIHIPITNTFYSNITGSLLYNSNASFTSPLSGTIDTNEGVIDYINLTELPVDFISGLNEEGFNKDNKYVCSDWNIKLTNLSRQRSNLGYDIFDFFENDDAYIYRVIFNKDGQDERVGFIDYSSMDKNLTPGEGKIITFNVFSAEKELADFMKNLVLFQMGYTINAGSYNETYNEFLQKFATTINCNLNDVTNIQQKYSAWYPGEVPKAYYDLLNVMKEEKLWDFFCGLFKQLGIMFKVTTDNLHINTYDKMTLKLFFKSDGNLIQDVKVISENEGNKGIDLKYQYWGIKNCYLERYEPNKVKENYNFAISAGGIDNGFPITQFSDHFVNAHMGHFQGNIKNWVSNWFPNWYYPDENVLWIDVPMYDCDLQYYYDNIKFKKITPISIFSKQNGANWDNNLINLSALQYDYLLTNLKKTKKLKIYFPNFFDYTIYNRFNYKDTEYYIEKISDINIQEKTATIEAVEK
jgi:hypothetical protein